MEEVFALCRRVDGNMPEPGKVRHVLKEIVPFAVNSLAVRNAASCSDVRTTHQRLGQISRHQEACTNQLLLRTLVRTIISQ